MSTIDAEKAARLRARLGKPPVEPSGNLSPPMNHEQPAPVIVRPAVEPRHEAAEAVRAVSAANARRGRQRRDIRTISATGRIVQFSSRISEDLDLRIGDIIERRQAEINAAARGPKYKYGICNFLEEAAFLFENTLTVKEDG